MRFDGGGVVNGFLVLIFALVALVVIVKLLEHI
jgi:hypothetical protein